MADERDKTPNAAILEQLFRDLPLPIAIYDLDGEPTPSSVPAKQGHMLVIDDEEMVRGLLAQMLQRLGYSVTRAGSAREGLQALEQEASAVCCVMLDLTMPEQDGSETFARIRERHPELPVIFMSGYEARSVPAANGFLHKPFTMNQLRQVLSDVLGEGPRT